MASEIERLRTALTALLDVVGEDSFCCCEECEKERPLRDRVIRDARALACAPRGTEPISEPIHTLTLTIHDGCGVLDLTCPHEGKPFAEDDAPDCRRLAGDDPLTRLSEKCLAAEAFGAYGDDCLEVDDFRPFEVTQYPIPVTYRWEGWGDDADFYVTPVAAPTPGHEGKP